MRFHLKDYILVLKILKRNKTRSFLTSVGIIIGIASVILIMSVGAGAQSLIIDQVEGMGSNLLGIMPGAAEEDGPPASAMGISITTLKYNDAQAIEKLEEIEYACSYITGSGLASYMGRTKDANFVGLTANYLKVEDTSLDLGRFITKEEETQVKRVVVLGSQVREDLFGNSDPINQKIKINKEIFKVIGVIKERGSSAFQNQDNQIFIPLYTAQKLMLGVNHLGYLRAKIADGVDLELAKSQVRQTIREQHNIDFVEEDDFSVRSTEDAMSMLGAMTDALRYFLTAIVAISLLVGGIGIMNIMLVSVNESTREIGLRKAVGATKKDISFHFLVQTILITLFGGIIGIIFGISISFLISVIAQYLGYNWSFIISFSSIILSFIFIILVGIMSGWYPAKKAADLNPIEALRYE